MKFKEYRKAVRLVEQAMLFKAYSESRKYRLELDYLQTTIHFVSGQYSKAFDCFRNLLAHESEKQINANAIWNLFTQIVNKMLDKRHHRFTLRLLFKRPKLIPLIIQNGNNSHLCGTYKYAIGNYIFLYCITVYQPRVPAHARVPCARAFACVCVHACMHARARVRACVVRVCGTRVCV